MPGNSSLEETSSVLVAALRALRQVLPTTWTIAPTPGSFVRGQASYSFDVGVEISTLGTRTTFFGRIFPGPISREDLRLYTDRVREFLEDTPLFLIIPFANPSLREICESRGVSYLDETGWIYLRDDHAGVFISREGSSKSPIESRQHSGMRRLSGPGASVVIRNLWDSTFPVGVRALAQQAGVSAGTVAKVLPELVEYGAVERSEQGEVLTINRRLLLERWAQDYGVFTSNREVRWFLAPRGPLDFYRKVLKLQSENSDLRIAYTGYIAAVATLPDGEHPVVPDTLVAAYVTDPDAMAEALNLRAVPRMQANVVLMRPRDEKLLNPYRLTSYVSLPQALVDLLTMGGRFPELSEQILGMFEKISLS